jgi:hypothetical protein
VTLAILYNVAFLLTLAILRRLYRQWGCFGIVMLLNVLYEICLFLLFRMKTHDLVFEGIGRRRKLSALQRVAFGEPSHGPCVVRIVVDAVVGYCHLRFCFFFLTICLCAFEKIHLHIEL